MSGCFFLKHSEYAGIFYVKITTEDENSFAHQVAVYHK